MVSRARPYTTIRMPLLLLLLTLLQDNYFLVVVQAQIDKPYDRTQFSSTEEQQEESGTSIDVTTEQYRLFCDLSSRPAVTLEWDGARYVLPSSILADVDPLGGTNTNNTSDSPTTASSSTPNANDNQEPDDTNNNNNNNNTTGTRRWLRRLSELLFMESDDYDTMDYHSTMERQQLEEGPRKYLRSPVPELFMQYESEPALSVVLDLTTSHRQLQFAPSSEPQPTTPVYVDRPDTTTNTTTTTMPRIPLTVQARPCDCWNSAIWGYTYYCTMPRTHCAIPTSPGGVPACVDIHKQRRIVRSIWPVLIVWYASVLFCLSFTLTGRHAMSCCLATIVPGWNQRTARRILRQDQNLANQMLLRHYRILRARHETRVLRRLQRRARRERRREQQRNNRNNNENENDRSDEEIEAFPSLWEMQIFPRRTINVNSEPVATTLKLKTRIYRHGENLVGIAKNDAAEVVDGPEIVVSLSQNREDLSATNGNPSNSGSELQTDKSEQQIKSDTVNAIDNHVNDEEQSSEGLEKVAVEAAVMESSTPTTNDNQVADVEDDENVNNSQNDCSSHSHASDADLSEWNDNTCSICYVPLEDGDRVGALPCGHVFHVDPCLKQWLTRRNVCPLCLEDNIATPQFNRPVRVESSSNNVAGQPAGFALDGRNGDDDDSSDQDRSSSRDDDDDSSGIMEGTGPNSVPVFGVRSNRAPNSATTAAGGGGGGAGRLQGLTSFFRRRNRDAARRTGNVELTTTSGAADTQ